MTTHLRYLRKLKQKYLAIRSAELLLFSLGVSLVVFPLASTLGMPQPRVMLSSILGGVTVFIAGFFLLKLHGLRNAQLISFINRKYAVMQQSTDLLFTDPASMTSLQRLQREKVQDNFEAVYRSVRFPNRINKAILFLAASGVFVLAMYFLQHPLAADKNTGHSIPSVANQPATVLPVAIKEITITVDPPGYTRRRTFTTQDPNITMPAGSAVSWNVVFTDSVRHVRILFSEGDSLIISANSGNMVQKLFEQSALYQFAWRTSMDEQHFSTYYRLDVIADEAPKIRVRDLPQFTELEFDDSLSVQLTTDLSDDYGLRDAYIVATVSKGSGESVKFREQKLTFQSPGTIEGRHITARTLIDLLSLGLSPGDELYFYVEASDNKNPSPNLARTETFFVALRDTASQFLSVDAGMGVDVMPEYFRSQRQIIIDSEKLLKEKKSISRESFNKRSNALGYDQKMLRLKYGEFLGEEFESMIGPGAEALAGEEGEDDHDGEPDDPLKQYSHQHDTDNEHNLVPEKRPAPGHDHGDPGKNEDPLEAYKHVHDDPEEATFFTQSIRTKLKAALSQMWDAELHLRLNEPQTSLPFQYRALKLLKEISEASRIYVHRTGFDPPPIKEERRLTGDLSEIKSSRHQMLAQDNESYPSIRKALRLVENKLQQSQNTFTSAEQSMLVDAGQELAGLALQEPGKYLHGLGAINSLHEAKGGDESINKQLLVLRSAFSTALPREKELPSQREQIHHTLNRELLERLQDR